MKKPSGRLHVSCFHVSAILVPVPRPISQRLLSTLQLTRMALVFTAISNSVCSMLLLAQSNARMEGVAYTQFVSPSRMAAVVIMSIGLYGFGMSLNDIIDRRRDA